MWSSIAKASKTQKFLLTITISFNVIVSLLTWYCVIIRGFAEETAKITAALISSFGSYGLLIRFVLFSVPFVIFWHWWVLLENKEKLSTSRDTLYFTSVNVACVIFVVTVFDFVNDLLGFAFNMDFLLPFLNPLSPLSTVPIISGLVLGAGLYLKQNLVKREPMLSWNNKFIVCIVFWIFLILFTMFIGLESVSAALIGAGAPSLYFLYKEAVDKPEIDIAGEIKYSKFLLKGEISNQSIVYPLIHAFVPLENKGKATAYDCFGIVRTGEGAPFGRWAGINEQEMDLHPGLKHRLVLMRFLPSPGFAKKLNQKLSKKGLGYTVVKPNSFPYLSPFKRDKGIKKGGLTIHVQNPRGKKIEERYGLKESDVFWGIPIKSKPAYKVSLQIGAENYKKIIENIGEISIKDALKNGKWQAPEKNKMYDPLRKFLANLGWKDI